MIYETIGLLGKRATDKVTGFKGVVTSACFDLYGCVQVTLHPGLAEDGKIRDSHWFDVQRLEISDEPAVLAAPDFDASERVPQSYDHGPAEKPLNQRW
jgi:hypothetical protein